MKSAVEKKQMYTSEEVSRVCVPAGFSFSHCLPMFVNILSNIISTFLVVNVRRSLEKTMFILVKNIYILGVFILK